ncbi:MAG: hypothetical protein XD78_1780 [Desulfotomaculum sp. 46_296]|nr:MAG: hypothetical protein XD78_1780 [Desulfotomaculum sp. 46_296]
MGGAVREALTAGVAVKAAAFRLNNSMIFYEIVSNKDYLSNFRVRPKSHSQITTHINADYLCSAGDFLLIIFFIVVTRNYRAVNIHRITVSYLWRKVPNKGILPKIRSKFLFDIR